MRRLKQVDTETVVAHMATLDEALLPGGSPEIIAALLFTVADRAVAAGVSIDEIITNIEIIFGSRAESSHETRTGLN